MASNFEVKYPSNGKQITFDGGMNNKFSKQLLEDNQSPDCMNVVFGDRSVETRGGTDKLNTTSVGTFACDGIYTRHANSGAETMVAWYGGTLYGLATTTFVAVDSAVSVYTAGQRVTATEYQDYMFFGNGASTPYKYNGAEFTRHGIPAPTETMTVSNAATGTVLTGDYQYKVTYVNSGLVQGDVSPATATWTAAGQNGLVTSIPVAPTSFGVNSRKLYRTVASGTVYFLVTTIEDNTTTSYEDAIADEALGATAPTDQGEPGNYSFVLYHQSRIFTINPATNWVEYSEIGDPFIFKALSFARIGDNTGDIPTGLAVYDNSLVVFAKRSTWLIYMESTDDTTWRNIRIRTPFGSNSPFAPFFYNDRIMFAARENEQFVGFAALAGTSVDPSATLLTVSAVNSDLKSNMIEPDMLTVPNASVSRMSAITFQNKAYIAVTYGSGETKNNRVYHFDYSMENLRKSQKFMWSPWDGMEPEQFTVYDNKVFFGTSNDEGFVYQMNTSTYNDDGAAIDSYYWTKEFDLGTPNWHKDFRWLYLLHGLPGAYYMNMSTRVDSSEGSGVTEQISVDPGTSLWGTMVWGRDNWDAGTAQKEIKKSLGQFKGKRIQFRFDNTNTANQKFQVVSMNLIFNLKGKR